LLRKSIAAIVSNGLRAMTTAFYADRKFGVKAGISIRRAKQQRLQIILLLETTTIFYY
jgi:hypothetical protein